MSVCLAYLICWLFQWSVNSHTNMKTYNINISDLNFAIYILLIVCKFLPFHLYLNSPIKEIGLCGARLISNCSKDLAEMGKNVVLELLRTDCGGKRPLTNGSANINSGLLLFILVLLHSLVEVLNVNW